MESEIANFIKVCITATLSGCYCYALSKSTSKGLLRLLLVLPVAAVFAAAPYSLSSFHLVGNTWLLLTWLGISKLILFSFGSGPLSQNPQLSLPDFLCILLLPIKLKQPRSDPEPENLKVNGRSTSGSRWWKYALFGVKLVGFGCVIEAYNHREGMSSVALLTLYCCHIYLDLDIFLVVTGLIACGSLDIAPQADEPYLTTSLQDFWGRRWNLMVSDILRQTVYDPIRSFATPLIGRKLSALIGVLASFLVSGLMHEWVFYHFTHVTPTWEVTCFFVLHGVCQIIEMMIKTAHSDKLRLHRAISGPLTLGFVAITAFWLFLSPLLRNEVHEKAIDESAMVETFLKRNLLYLFRR